MKVLFIPIHATLSYNEQEELLNNLAARKDTYEVFYSKLKTWRTNTVFRYYLGMVGGFPRGIEYYLQIYLSKESTTAQNSFDSASERLRSAYAVFSITFYKRIAIAIITRRLLTREDKVDNLTWSELENKGAVMLQPAKHLTNNLSVIAYYPPILLVNLLDYHSQVVCKTMLFDEKKMLRKDWDNIIHCYTYLIFSILKGEQNVPLYQLFPFAKMNSTTEQTKIDHIPSNIALCFAIKPIHKMMSSTQRLQTVNSNINGVKLSSNAVYLVNQHEMLVIKNKANAQAGNVLIFGLRSGNEVIVLHFLGKWRDTTCSTISYKDVEMAIAKNKRLQFDNGTPIRNITVIITAKDIAQLPTILPNDVVIIDNEIFDNYFGPFSEIMRSICT